MRVYFQISKAGYDPRDEVTVEGFLNTRNPLRVVLRSWPEAAGKGSPQIGGALATTRTSNGKSGLNDEPICLNPAFNWQDTRVMETEVSAGDQRLSKVNAATRYRKDARVYLLPSK